MGGFSDMFGGALNNLHNLDLEELQSFKNVYFEEWTKTQPRNTIQFDPDYQDILFELAMREADVDWELHYSTLVNKNTEQLMEVFEAMTYEIFQWLKVIDNSKKLTNNVLRQVMHVMDLRSEPFDAYNREFEPIQSKYRARSNTLGELEKVVKRVLDDDNPSSTVGSALFETDSSLDPSGDDDQSNERESVTENVEKIQSDSKNCMGCDESVCDNTNAGNGQKGHRGLEEVQNEAGDTCPAPDPITGRTPKVFVERAKGDWKMELFVALAAGFVVALLIKEDKYGV
jgi:hypothetical protein